MLAWVCNWRGSLAHCACSKDQQFLTAARQKKEKKKTLVTRFHYLTSLDIEPKETRLMQLEVKAADLAQLNGLLLRIDSIYIL